MGKVKLFCIIAFAVLLAVPAYAEVQNVKVSGDLSARWFLRGSYDLDKDAANVNAADISDTGDDFLMSTAEVQVDADLTDNVSTRVRIANQRDWGDNTGLAQGITTQQFDMLLDLASVTLKEMVYSPLTVTIGRQDLWFGKGFIIGAKQRDPQNVITANEYTVINSFDAIRATLDFDPWKIDAVYSLLEENVTNKNDDMYLLGANLGYKFSSYNGEAEAYIWNKYDRSHICYPNTAAAVVCDTNFINTYGIRGSFEPIANATIAAEGAIQGGRYSVLSPAGTSRARAAHAIDLSGDYLLKDVKWTPKLGLEYIKYSGDQDDGVTVDSHLNAWDPMYRGKFDSAIREFQNVYYFTAQRTNNAANTVIDPDSGITNEHQLIFKVAATPITNLKFDGRFTQFWFVDAPISGISDKPVDAGRELDLNLTYDYTEDVSFGLLAAWFFPGNYWVGGQDDVASDIVGTVKVAF